MGLHIIPLTIRQANDLVKQYHRHHKPVHGARFAIGAVAGMDDFFEGDLVGAAIVGRPVARMTDQYRIAEVTRLVTNGYKNVCSFLYSACARIAREMGFEKIQTFILESEPGTSLTAAGWKLDGVTKGGSWNCPSRGHRREDQPLVAKHRYIKILN